MDSIVALAGRLDGVAQTMMRAGAALADLDPDGAAFSDGAPGRLGEAARALHAQVVSAIGARSREAAVAGARLSDTAQALRFAVTGYLDADEAARGQGTGFSGQMARLPRKVT